VAERVFLHVGTMKSGTTFLQNLWWYHHDALAGRGLVLPARRRDHFRSASIVCQRTEVLEGLTPEEHRAFDLVLEEAAAAPRDVLVSHELFSPATPTQAAEALARLGTVAQELHVVLTVRDLARQLRSHWQEMVKQRSSTSLTDYAERVRTDPGDDFWTFQDVGAILDRWSQGVPPERVHVVVNPTSAPRSWLWEATAGVFGVDVAGLDVDVDTANTSLGLAEVEVVRRVQGLVPPDEAGLELTRIAKGWFAPLVVQADRRSEGFANPPWVAGWAREEGARTAALLTDRGYDVRGDLADLAPAGEEPTGLRQADEVTPDEVAEVALAALARLLVHEKHQRARIERLRNQRQRLQQRLRGEAAD
jgi:hypothetical protein